MGSCSQLSGCPEPRAESIGGGMEMERGGGGGGGMEEGKRGKEGGKEERGTEEKRKGEGGKEAGGQHLPVVRMEEREPPERDWSRSRSRRSRRAASPGQELLLYPTGPEPSRAEPGGPVPGRAVPGRCPRCLEASWALSAVLQGAALPGTAPPWPGSAPPWPGTARLPPPQPDPAPAARPWSPQARRGPATTRRCCTR